MGRGFAALCQELHRSRAFGPRFYGSQGVRYRVVNPKMREISNVGRYEVRIFSVLENGENGLSDEGDDGAIPPLQNFWARTATAFTWRTKRIIECSLGLRIA